nr:hypothetical protein [uncultured Cetobacterium sp.]
MKKIFLLALILGVQSFSKGEAISQENLKEQLVPKLQKSVVFEKFKPVLVRKGVLGENIKTYTKDGLETSNTVVEDSYIIKNMTEAKEQYIIKKDKFEKRYKFVKSIDGVWGIYQPIGEIKVVKIKNKDEFYIVAPWGEKMIVKENDFLVSPLDYSEIYRIANKEFFETYRQKGL